MLPEICNQCIRLEPAELWDCKSHLRSSKIKCKLRDLANPECKKCHGSGIMYRRDIIL